jgi:hypothetical protein
MPTCCEGFRRRGVAHSAVLVGSAVEDKNTATSLEGGAEAGDAERAVEGAYTVFPLGKPGGIVDQREEARAMRDHAP